MTRQRIRWVVLAGLLLIAFALLGLAVSRHPLSVDRAVADGLRGQWQQPAGRVAAVVSAVLGPVLPIVFGCALLVGAVLSWRRGDSARASVSLRVALVLVLCRLTSVAFKPVLDRQRPRVYPDVSYPSGHVVAVASTGLAVVLLYLWLAPRLVRRVVAIAAVATVLSAAARLVVGVHWLTDTVGAVLAVTGVGLLAAVALRLLPRATDPVPADADTA